MPTASDVAKYFLAQMSEECGDTISNLKLQKLMYYAQGFHLAITGKPLFEDVIKAWEHGPVVPSVWREYNQHGSGALPKPEGFDFSVFSSEQREALDEVYKVYGQFSAWKLRNMTHEESPWKNTPRNGTISPDLMRSFFKSQLIEE